MNWQKIKRQIIRGLKIFAGIGIPVILGVVAYYFRELMVASTTMKGTYSGIALIFILCNVVYCVLVSPRMLLRR